VDLPGWQAEPADGADASAQGMRAVTAYRSYEDGERRLDANLLVGVQAGMSWLPDYQEGFRMETPEGLMEVKRIGGFLVHCTFEREEGSGGIIVLLQDGSATPDLGAVFVVSFEGLALEEALRLAQRFSGARMKDPAARLKGRPPGGRPRRGGPHTGGARAARSPAPRSPAPRGPCPG